MNKGDANEITREYLDSILIEERLINTDTASTKTEIFGEVFDTPIMMPAFSHLASFGEGRESGLVEYARAAKEMNALNWIGMSENPLYEEIAATGAKTVRIVKPYADRDKIFDQLEFGEQHGAFALGIDTDHTIGSDGKYDFVMGEHMAVQSSRMIREYVESTKLPFVIKGVLSVKDAAICAECGVKGIVVSHHHGRLPFAIPPLMVLNDICKELQNTGIKVFADCHIDTGFDAFKALALGADAVSVGRAMLPMLQSDGTEGVKTIIRKMTEELSMAMAFTNSRTTDQIDPSVLWNKNTGERLVR